MSKLIEELKNFLKSDESKKFFDKLAFIDSRILYYIDLFHSYPFDKKCKIIDKIIKKYESDEYNDKEYKHGRQPQCKLYSMLHSYCLDYADKKYYDESIPFENECFIFCLNYRMKVIYGQGTMITVDKFREISNDAVTDYSNILKRIGKDAFESEFISDYDNENNRDTAIYVLNNL